MANAVDVAHFLRLSADPDWQLIDVRAPREHRAGHIPGAHSVPLFSDAERAVVGTLYKQQGREAALLRGLEIVGPKLADFVRSARKLAPGGRLAVHCWRGGMRSESLSELWSRAGFEVRTLAGGYKAYRRYIREAQAQPRKLLILGGMTGSGKTRVLHALAARGEQILDLEGLARHKGSAFGAIGEQPQPTNEQFENNLYQALQMLDPTRPTWVEDESIGIGRVFVPVPFWEQMQQAPVLVLEVPVEQRVAHLVAEYAAGDPAKAADALQRIQKRLGGQQVNAALEALSHGDFATTAEIALAYYDKAYRKDLARKADRVIGTLTQADGDPEQAAERMLSLRHQLLPQL